jgi:hypothetical protein
LGKSDKEVAQIDSRNYLSTSYTYNKMSAAGASGGPLANSIPTTMATLPHAHEESGIAMEGDETPKGSHTSDNASDGDREGEKGVYLNEEEEEEQEGARQMSAITQTWDKKSLVAVYALFVYLWIVH